ncbi:MAG: BamA/TamA family outer membrane protein [Bacteroidota bacterium]
MMDPASYPAKLVMAPVVVFEPATSWGAGIGAKVLFKFAGSGEETRTSNLPISVLYTLNNQFIISSGYTIFFNQEKWYLTGNIEFSLFPQSYYGIGSTTREEEEEIFSFDRFLFEPILLKKVHKKLFVGGGLRYNFISNTELEPEGSLIREMPTGFDGSTSAGLEFAMVWDNRDNVLNAQKGSFVEFKQGFYETWLGGSHRFRFNQLDARTYIRPWKSREDILAFNLFSRFAWGDVPVAELSVFGGAERGRGYREGRYRDFNTISAQMEYRWQAFDRVGFVFYGGIGDVFDEFNNINLNTLKYNTGLGLRLKIVKEENLNIRFDYGFGFGFEFDHNFYLGIAEAF